MNVYARRGRARRRRRKCLYERVFLAGPRARARRSGYLVSYTGAPEEGRDAGPIKGGLPLPSNVSGRDRFGRGVRAPVFLRVWFERSVRGPVQTDTGGPLRRPAGKARFNWKCNHRGACPAARPATRPATSGLTFGRASGSCSGHGAAAFRPRAGRRSGLVRPRGRTPVPDTCPAIRLAVSARAHLRDARCRGSTPPGGKRGKGLQQVNFAFFPTAQEKSRRRPLEQPGRHQEALDAGRREGPCVRKPGRHLRPDSPGGRKGPRGQAGGPRTHIEQPGRHQGGRKGPS